MKLEEWLDIWLWDYKANNIRPLTFESYERIIRLYIKPKLGSYKLSDLKNHDIQKEVNKLGASRTTELFCTILKASLRHAVRLDMLLKNPSEYIIIPRKNKRAIKPLNVKERHELTKALSSHRLGVAFYLLVVTGMRKGELLALKWDDIDFRNKMINVSKSSKRIRVFKNREPAGYENVEGNTKTEKGRRIIPMLDKTVAMMKYHMAKQNIEKVKAKQYQDKQYVFCSRQGKVISGRNFNKYFYKFLADNGIDKITPHGLRHTFATAGLENGIELKSMQELLGHSSINVTANIYTHVSNSQKRQEIQKLKDAF